MNKDQTIVANIKQVLGYPTSNHIAVETISELKRRRDMGFPLTEQEYELLNNWKLAFANFKNQ